MSQPLRRDLLQAGALLPFVAGLPAIAAPAGASDAPRVQSWKLATRRAVGIHDVSPAPDHGIWFTAQGSGHLGWFDPATGRTDLIPLGNASSPHGVIVGPDRAAWITDGGQNAIVRVGWPDRHVRVYRLPQGAFANLNTCAFDGDGDLWFTGQSGYVGRLAVKSGRMTVKKAPRGVGPYGITSTPSGDVWYCSLAASFIAKIDRRTGESTPIDPPTPESGPRRIWSDNQGRLWTSEWNAGQLSVFDPRNQGWQTFKLPGNAPHAYAVYVDDRDTVWISDWGSNSVLSFDPASRRFTAYPMPRESANVRQLLGRKGEVWVPESGTDYITVIRTA
ncbi:virginiamycin B lyase family protein [Ramlibacter sp. MMS24-I3-19]|uniref:Vgb family protein n=1 Tax=Ramlibacter sp. MMS24-I3-19 TaxID=3416606 RepID=UPI003CFD1472